MFFAILIVFRHYIGAVFTLALQLVLIEAWLQIQLRECHLQLISQALDMKSFSKCFVAYIGVILLNY